MPMVQEEKLDKLAVIRYAGAFSAWVIGSGFATGQEILQFFTGFGRWSYAVIILNALAYIGFNLLLFFAGYRHRDKDNFNHFEYFLNKQLGRIYNWSIPVILLAVMPVLISGAGATLYEHYNIPHYLGSALMTILVLLAYLAGFEKLVKIVSSISSVIVILIVTVALLSCISNFSHFSTIASNEPMLQEKQNSPHWLISAILYVSLIYLTGSSYFTSIGKTAEKKRELKYGALAGAIIVILTIAALNTAMFLKGEEVADRAIPMLYLANEISAGLGSIFSIVLVLGIFPSCSAMLWTVCSRFKRGGVRGNKLFAVAIAAFIYIVSLFSFTELVAVLYPLVGYLGLVFTGGMIFKGIKEILARKAI